MKLRTSRKTRGCAGTAYPCHEPIAPGDGYLALTLTPWDDMGDGHFHHAALCLSCAKQEYPCFMREAGFPPVEEGTGQVGSSPLD